MQAGIAGLLAFFEGSIHLALVAGLCISSIYVERAGNEDYLVSSLHLELKVVTRIKQYILPELFCSVGLKPFHI